MNQSPYPPDFDTIGSSSEIVTRPGDSPVTPQTAAERTLDARIAEAEELQPREPQQ